MRKAIVFITTTTVIAEDSVLAFLQRIAGKVTPKFVAIRNYENNQHEISDYVINVGEDYGKRKAQDIEKLKDAKNFAKTKFEGLAVATEAETARKALLVAMLKETPQSKAQKEAYLTIAPNIRLHLESGKLFVFGFKISKKVLVEGVYPSVNSSNLTLAKEAIRKDLKSTKFRQYALDKIKDVRMDGETLVIGL